MKKFLFILFGVFAFSGAFAAGENVPTSKSYVDSKLGEKQDIIPANDGATQVLTNTGVAGEYGTKGIYDANGAYATQTQNLVDAATMNAGVQNAIDSEFQCIEWLDPNDHSSDCLLMDVGGQTNLLGKPVAKLQAEFDTKNHIMTNTSADTRNALQLLIALINQTNGLNFKSLFYQFPDIGTTRKIVFSSSDYKYLYIKHNGAKLDNRLFWELEPNVVYALTFNVLSNDPTTIGGIRIYLDLKRENYLPAGN